MIVPKQNRRTDISLKGKMMIKSSPSFVNESPQTLPISTTWFRGIPSEIIITIFAHNHLSTKAILPILVSLQPLA